MPRLSVIIITYNEERNIERCLRSVQWADEIIVVDSLSTDRTVEICKQFTGNILLHEYDGDIPQRERGFALASGEWLMYIDADEEISIELKDEILGVINGATPKEGYSFLRKSFIFGTWTEHGGWFPDYTFRLFRKDSYVAEYAEVHGGFSVRGEKGVLNGHLYHYTYESIEQYLSKMNDYTSLAVFNKLKDDPSIDVGVMKIVLSPLSHFFRKFISTKGYKDGLHGFILAALGGIYTLALYTKLWEYRMRQREGLNVLPPITNLELQRAKRL
jgi:glycosyltransferase involved in cell wall biosynthesis